MDIISHSFIKYKLESFQSLDECINWCIANKPIVKHGYSNIDSAKSSDHYLPSIVQWWSKWRKATPLKEEEGAFEDWISEKDIDTDYEAYETEKLHWLDGYNYANKKYQRRQEDRSQDPAVNSTGNTTNEK